MRPLAISALLLVGSCRSVDSSRPFEPPMGAFAAGGADAGAQQGQSADMHLEAPGESPDLGAVAINNGPDVDAGADMAIVDLVSPSVCRMQGEHLVDCAVDEVRLRLPGSDSARAVRTGVSGGCSTQFELEVKLQLDAEPAVLFYPLQAPRSVVLRRADQSSIEQLLVSNASPFAGTPAYDASCHIWLAIGSVSP